ncbi:hypothetical protein NQ176_g1873 [Zarea fungicola]|uniref:Uncharacterized protein n=1 Tax=Zarea fungicola TaxID=93591 RepID=A0ACC1NS93_9HYPO|nr:hypothetical protein NQ176_g1873 [Lecanicillium fungicola]
MAPAAPGRLPTRRAGDCIRVPGEGMPVKRGDAKGDLYLLVSIEFPDNDFLKDAAAYEALLKMLPPPLEAPKTTGEVDEVEYESDADIETMGENSGDPRFGNEWEDEDAEDGQPQCQAQ